MHLLSKTLLTLSCFLSITFAFGNEYKVDQNGKISFVRQTDHPKDILIAVFSKKEKIRYKDSGLPRQDYIEIKKGILPEMVPLEDTYDGRTIKGHRLNFEKDSTTAIQVFEFLADHTLIEWSLLTYGDSQNSRSKVYTSYRHDLEYFGAKRASKLANSANISFLKHYHNHPRYDYEGFGKYAFPSNPDLKFRDQIQSKNIAQTEFKIRTDGMYVDYGSPLVWGRATTFI